MARYKVEFQFNFKQKCTLNDLTKSQVLKLWNIWDQACGDERLYRRRDSTWFKVNEEHIYWDHTLLNYILGIKPPPPKKATKKEVEEFENRVNCRCKIITQKEEK